MSGSTLIGRVIGDIYNTHQPTTRTYRILDEVRLRSGWYRAVQDVPLNVPVDDASYWQLTFTPEIYTPIVLKAHDSALEYEKGTEIRLKEGWYRALQFVPADIALSNDTYWDLSYTPASGGSSGGRVGDVFFTHSATRTYLLGDEVRLTDAWYRAVTNVPVNTQLSNSAYWVKVFDTRYVIGYTPIISTAHNDQAAYNVGDEIRLQDAWYRANTAVPANAGIPLTNEDYWQKVYVPSTALAGLTADMILAALANPEGEDDMFLNKKGQYVQVAGGGVVSKTAIMSALREGSPTEPDPSRFLAEDGSFHVIAQEAKFLPLESMGDNLDAVMELWETDRLGCIAMADRNQTAIDMALGKIDENGLPILDTDDNQAFNIDVGVGYFPITGNLVIPPRSGKFLGQGGYRRFKSISKVGGGQVQDAILEYPTCFLPIGGNDNNGMMTQCSSAHVGRFAILGALKDPGDGGNAFMTGHTAPVPDAANSVVPTTWAASLNNDTTQDRFGQPIVVDLDPSAISTLPNGDVAITVPVRGSFSSMKDLENLVADDDMDIPLVRWVRTFDAEGRELDRYSNISYKEFNWLNYPGAPGSHKIELKDSQGVKGYPIIWGARNIVGIGNTNRMTTSRPATDELGNIVETERVYHLPIGENDTTTTVIIPGGLRDEVVPHPTDPTKDVSATPADVASIQVSFYNLEKHQTLLTELMPYLGGGWSAAARCQFNIFDNLVLDGMPWNGFVGIDGAYNNHTCISSRNNGLDGFYFPGGYEDYMHNSFDSCSSVNNQGWAIYISEAKKGISGLPNPDSGYSSGGGWPVGDTGEVPVARDRFISHKKVTYTASLNDFRNFDSYGNRGGAMYFGGDSNTMSTGGAEHHFDSHNVDPLGRYNDWVDDYGQVMPGTYIDVRDPEINRALGDWNPLRWIGCFVFAAVSRQNDITITGTPTDTRRCLFAKWRNYLLKPVHDTSNLYRAITSNHYVHPRNDNYGCLVDTRSKSIANLFLAQYPEHERTGDILNYGEGVIELLGTFIKKDTYGVMPFLYPISNQSNLANSDMSWAFTNKHPDSPCPGGSFTLSADRVGIVGQSDITMLYVNNSIRNLKGVTIGPGESFIDNIVVPTMEGFDPEADDIERLVAEISYISDVLDTRTNERLPDHIRPVLQGFERMRNGVGDMKIYIRFAWHNFSTTETFTIPAEQDEKHMISYRVMNHTPNQVLKGL